MLKKYSTEIGKIIFITPQIPRYLPPVLSPPIPTIVLVYFYYPLSFFYTVSKKYIISITVTAVMPPSDAALNEISVIFLLNLC